MEKFQEVYELNIELEKIYHEKYCLSDNQIFKKNILALLGELGELANSSKIFKYWSIKPPSDRSVILEEYADCVLFTLVFLGYLNVSLDEKFNEPSINNTVDQFLSLYKQCSDIVNNYNKDYMKDIFVNLLYLGKLLGFTEEEIIDGCMNKLNKNDVRVKSNTY